MIDSGSFDEKIIAIPYNDPTYNTYHDISELPAHIFDEMMHFFKVYKHLENKQTAVKEIKNRDEAIKIIKAAMENYNNKFSK